MATIAITYVGGPTALLEIGGLRLLTDPTFDPAGGRYNFGLGANSEKLQGPALAPEELGAVDVVLLSHDQHDDNLDAAGRELLGKLGAKVLTTPAGAKRLGGDAVGLPPWTSTTLPLPDSGELKLTSTPCRHGPPLSGPLVGQVTGFVLEWPGQEHGALWWSGDTVYFKGVAEVGERFEVGTAILNLGGVRFPLSGPSRYTLNAAEAVRLDRDLKPRTLVPLHFEGWKHFREAREEVESEFADAGIAERVRWPLPAERVEIEV
jgi:L-ascorbate metabolism protein UlaG (beta-lactamase superfamily)